MELREFVKNTILDIMDGVDDAQKVNETTGIINAEHGDGARDFRSTHDLLFDIAISATNSHENGRGIDVAVPFLDGGFRIKKKIESRSESRIQFTIPVLFPKFSSHLRSQDADFQ